MITDAAVAVLGVVAYSGTGKTTLLQGVLPLLTKRGIRCAVVKHSHHDFEIDIPGKDSHRLRTAGAQQVLLASPHRRFWVEEGDGVSEPRLDELIARLDLPHLDLVLVEGFREARLAKIEVCRPALGNPMLCRHDPDVIAVAADAEIQPALAIPVLPLNRPEDVTAFIADWMSRQSAAST